ncbi:MAG TPA: 6-phosphogluconolactonase [Solirubrobacteraceae bacterium]|nr:6-phosphogluconolactonase [Solirubrobacteraceae bacterium]
MPHLLRDGSEPPPTPLVVADPHRIGLVAAELVANRMSARAPVRVLLPTGRSPDDMYAALRAHAAAGHLSSGATTVLQLDEYAGIRAGDPRSFAAELRRQLAGIPVREIRTLDGGAADLAAEAARHAAALEEAPIDLAVLGLGRDGHVAFDEPPARVASGVSLVRLTETTRADAATAFGSAGDVPVQALTTGLGTLYRARELILLVSGRAKAPALRAMLEAPVGPACPASLLRDHPRLTIICDRDAAAELSPRRAFGSDRAIVILGHRDPGVSPEHRISAESRARLRHGLRLAHRGGARAVVLTGYTSTGGLSEAEQMKGAWDEHVAPALLEVAGRDTAENASRTLPILIALGEARRVTVVSSPWHLRVPWYFAPYREFGFDVSYRPSAPRGHWGRMLGEELREARGARPRRRAVMAAMHPPPEIDR